MRHTRAPRIFDRQVWLTANRFIARHGVDAEVLACLRAEQLSIAGDVDGMTKYTNVAKAIRSLHAAPVGLPN